MAHMSPLNAYKEVRLDLDPAIQSSTVAIRLPPHGASRTTQKRSHVVEVPIAEDESAFRQKHLATSASIYHRAHHRSPRTFLWRILEEGKVLSIRAVDVSRQDKTTDANLTLRFEFPSPIRPACVALSDSREHDVLSVFVLTESKHLYTLSLRPDFFRKPSSTEDNVGDWCKSYLSSQFAFKTPHRLAALAADQLLISQIDGQLLRLERKSGGDGKLILLRQQTQQLTKSRFDLERVVLQRRRLRQTTKPLQSFPGKPHNQVWPGQYRSISCNSYCLTAFKY